jgi:hypothetical protein
MRSLSSASPGEVGNWYLEEDGMGLEKAQALTVIGFSP